MTITPGLDSILMLSLRYVSRAAAEAEIAKVKQAILMGVVGETTAAMLRDAEAKQAQATKRLADAEETRLAAPRLVPPQEVVKGLNSLHQRERREAYRRLLSEVRLTSHRAPGGKITDHWTAEIVAKPEAGITGLHKSVAFGKDGITVGRSASPSGTRAVGPRDGKTCWSSQARSCLLGTVLVRSGPLASATADTAVASIRMRLCRRTGWDGTR